MAMEEEEEAEGEGGDGTSVKNMAAEKSGGGKKLAPYFAFSKQRREEVKAQIVAAGGKPSASAISKSLGELWRSLSDAERQAFSNAPLAPHHSTVSVNEPSKVSDSGNGDVQQQENPRADRVSEEKSNTNGNGDVLAPFPVARVKRIIRLDKDIRMVSSDGVSAITQATQLFLETLAVECFSSMLKSKRKSVRLLDVEAVIKTHARIRDFIGDSLHSVLNHGQEGDDEEDESCEETEEVEGAMDEGDPRSKKMKGARKAVPEPPPGSRSITDFFGSKLPTAQPNEAHIQVL